MMAEGKMRKYESGNFREPTVLDGFPPPANWPTRKSSVRS